MKKRKKLLKSLGAGMLAALFLVQAVFGLLPPLEAQAAITAIEEWDENHIMDYKYRFNVKFQKALLQ